MPGRSRSVLLPMDDRVAGRTPAGADAAARPDHRPAGTALNRSAAHRPVRLLARCGTVAGTVERGARRGADWLLVSGAGVVLGLLFFCVSLTPSLLPRSWFAQG